MRDFLYERMFVERRYITRIVELIFSATWGLAGSILLLLFDGRASELKASKTAKSLDIDAFQAEQ